MIKKPHENCIEGGKDFVKREGWECDTQMDALK